MESDGGEWGWQERPSSRGSTLRSPKAANRSVMSSPGRNSALSNTQSSPLRAARRKSVAAVEQHMLGGEYRVFPLSKYQGDGWEPFLPKNPLEGTTFEGIAIDFESRRRRLDVVRNKSLLRGDDDDDWKKIASKRTARRLAKEGIAADGTGMGLFSKGVVLVDEKEEQYLEPSWYEPTQDQIKRFLRAEAKRVWTQDGRLDALVQRILKETKEKDEEEDEGYEQFEEDDYRTALRVLAKLQSRPRILCCAITLTGSGSSNFVTTDKRIRNRSWVVFRRAMAESLGLTEIEIAIVSATTTTVGTLSESVDVDFRICTPHAELAEVLAELIEECVEDGSLGRCLTMFNLQSLTSLRKGPAIFEFPGGYDATERLFGEQAVELRQQIAAWEYELMKKKQKPHKRAEPTHGHVYQDDEVETVQAPDTPTLSGIHSRKQKRFKLTQGDTLEQEGAAPQSPRPPHGFVLQQRPQSSLDRIQAYAPLQSSHSMDSIPRPKSEIAMHREAREPACDRRGVGVQPQEAGAPNEKLVEYFKTRVRKKATPQRGDVTRKIKEYRSQSDATKTANQLQMKENRELRARQKQELVSRSRSIGVGGWGDDTKSFDTESFDARSFDVRSFEDKSIDEVKAMAAVLPSIDNSLQNARFKAHPRVSVVKETRIQASSSTDFSSNSPIPPPSSALEKTGLAALSLSKEVADAVQKSELSVEDVLTCTEEELMEMTGLGQLDCWRLKKKLMAQEEQRKNHPDALRERARLAAEERKRLQSIGSRVNAGSRDSKEHAAYEQQRRKEREAQWEEQRRNRAKEAERERERFRSVKSIVDTGSKILPPRSVTGERSGLSAFSEHSDDHGLGADPYPGPSGEGATHHERGERSALVHSPARHGIHTPGPGGALDFKGASRRDLLVEGAGSGKKGSYKDRARPAAVAVSREASRVRNIPSPSLDGSDALSVQSLATPSKKDASRGTRSPARHRSGKSRQRSSRSLSRGRSSRSAAHDSEDSVDNSGFSPFEEGVHEEPSHETLLLASLGKTSLGPFDSIHERASTPTKSKSHKGQHYPRRRRSSVSHSSGPSEPRRRRKSISPPRSTGPKITLPGQWSSLLNDVLPDSSKAKSPLRKHGSKQVKKKSKRLGSPASHDSDGRDSVASLESVNSIAEGGLRSIGPCLCCKGTKRLALEDLPEYLQEILPAIGKTWVDCPLCCPLTHIEIAKPPSKKVFALKPWKAKQHRPEVGNGLVVIDRDESHHQAREKKTRVVSGIAMDVKTACVVVVFSNGDLEEYELATGNLVHVATVPVAGAIYSVCKNNSLLYLGMDSCIQEITLLPNATPGRTFKGQDGHILCLSPCEEESILVSGSRDQTAFVWDLTTGKVLSNTITLDKDLPKNLRSFAVGLPAHTQAFAFRHHSGPVSCCSASKGVFITGGWDGLLCVVTYPAYKDRWKDEQLANLMRDRIEDLKKRSQELKDEMNQFKSTKARKQIKSKLESELNSNEDMVSLVSNTLVGAEARLKIASIKCRKFLSEPDRDVGRVTSLAFTQLENRTYGLFAGYSDGKVRQWDVLAGTVVHLFMTWVPMSVTSVCLGIGRVYCGYANGLIKVWNLTTLHQQTIRTQKNAIDLVGHQDGVAFMLLCDNLLFSCSDDKSMRTWDLRICDPEMRLPMRPAPPPDIRRSESNLNVGKLRHAHLEEFNGAVSRVISIPDRVSSVVFQEVTQQEEESSSSKEEEVEAEPEAPLELQELSASLPFDPSVYSESKAEQNELLSELLEIGQAVENLGDSLVDQTIKARAYVLRHPSKQAKGARLE